MRDYIYSLALIEKKWILYSRAHNFVTNCSSWQAVKISTKQSAQIIFQMPSGCSWENPSLKIAVIRWLLFMNSSHRGKKYSCSHNRQSMLDKECGTHSLAWITARKMLVSATPEMESLANENWMIAFSQIGHLTLIGTAIPCLLTQTQKADFLATKAAA